MVESYVRKLMVVLTFSTYLVLLTFGIANLTEKGGVFYTSTIKLDQKYYQEVTPKEWSFAICLTAAYLWYLCALVYIVVSMFRRPNKSPVNVEPTLISIHFLLGNLFMNVSIIAWLFLFDREILRGAFGLITVSALAMYFSLFESHKLVYDNLVFLDNRRTKVLLWMVRILIHNGLSIAASFSTYIMLLNLADLIIYQDSFGETEPLLRDNITIENGSTMVLSILFGALILWFIMENFLVEAYFRYTFTVFPTMVVMFSGVIAKLQGVTTRNFDFAVVVCTFCVFACVFRVGLFLVRRNARIAAEAVQ